jgi:hypothetical protein
LAAVSLTSYQQSNWHRQSNDEMQAPVIFTALLILCLIQHGALVSALKPRERLPAEKRIDFLGVRSLQSLYLISSDDVVQWQLKLTKHIDLGEIGLVAVECGLLSSF